MFDFIMLAMLYLAPSIGAFICKKEHAPAIFGVNLVFGWMALPWIICLIWAMVDRSES